MSFFPRTTFATFMTLLIWANWSAYEPDRSAPFRNDVATGAVIAAVIADVFSLAIVLSILDRK